MTAHDRHHAATGDSAPPVQHTGQHYEITVQGHLARRWSAWFDDLELVPTAEGTTVISGRIADQAALHGLLSKLRDLGIELLSLHITPTTDTERP